MIYVTGDTHGDIDFFKLKLFCDRNPRLTRDDYLIIAGDFGGLWSEQLIEEKLIPYTHLPFTILFVDGNHENFDMLEQYPVYTMFGGNVRIIRDNVIHLMRGQVYEIEGKTIFTLGGAVSVDKWRRKEGLSWWPQEEISDADFRLAIRNLEKNANTVDYIITHACDERCFYYPVMRNGTFKTPTHENALLSYFEDNVNYKRWYFGHYHIDADINHKKTALYQAVVELGKGVEDSKVPL